MAKELTLENIAALIQESERKSDLKLIKIEKGINDLKADAKRHTNRLKEITKKFDNLTSSVELMRRDDIINIKERLNDIEEALSIEREESGGTIQEQLDRLQEQIDAINEKLKAG